MAVVMFVADNRLCLVWLADCLLNELRKMQSNNKKVGVDRREPGARGDQGEGWAGRRRVLLAGVIIIAAGLLVYCNSFGGTFVFDDGGSIVENPNIRQLWPIWDVFDAQPGQTVAGRPVLSFSLAVNYRISTLNVWSYHLFNLTIHILTGLLLFGIVRRTLLSEGLQERFGQASTSLALICSLVWLVHPLQTGSVTYIVQRAESMMGMFYLLSLYCAIRGFSSPNSRRWYAAAITACALGVGTKEVAATIPLMILLYDRIFVTRSFKETLARRWGFYVGLGCTWVLVGALAWFAPRGGSVGFDDPNLTSWVYAMTQCKIIVSHYLKLIFWPVGLTLDYGWPIAKNFTEIAPYAVVLGGLLAGTVLAIWRRPRLGFLGVWFFVILAPSSSFLPILTEIAAEHRMYLPLAAVVVAVVLGIYSLGKHLLARSVNLGQQRGKLAARLGYGLAGLVVVLLGLGSAGRNDVYQNSFSIWDNTLANRPNNYRAYNNRGLAYRDQGNHDQALRDFTTSIGLKPTYAKAHNNRALEHSDNGDHELAMRDFNEAIRLDKKFYKAYINRSLEYSDIGEDDLAIQDLNYAIKLNPTYWQAYSNRGFTYARMGKYDLAIRDFNLALEIDPANIDIYGNRAMAYWDLGKFERAFADLNKAIKLDPQNALGYNNLGFAYLRNGDYDLAIANFDQAAKLDPESIKAYNNRATAHAKNADYASAVRDLRKSLELDPEDPLTHKQISQALKHIGMAKQAITHYRRALELKPDWPEVLNDLAWILATHKDPEIRNGQQALQLALHACQLENYKVFAVVDTLAAAYAETGKFDQAVKTAKTAMQLAQKGGLTPIAQDIRRRMDLYKAKLPYHHQFISEGRGTPEPKK